jgi:Ca2+-transporting ATPase
MTENGTKSVIPVSELPRIARPAEGTGAFLEGAHALVPEELARALAVDPIAGLSPEEARRRLESWGPNALTREEETPWWRVLLRQFTGGMVYLLSAAAGASAFVGERLDAGAILVVILINGIIGFLAEYRAEKALQALKGMTAPTARVVREGEVRTVAAEELVPGDLLILEAGDVPGADARLLEARQLASAEAALTGESAPVDKGIEPLPVATALADRKNCLFAGTAIVRGTARALVFATGGGAEIGRISGLLSGVEKGKTPLEERLERFTGFMIKLVLLIGAAVTGLGVLEGRPFMEMFETGIALAVAAVPEGLPFVATMTLAIGVHQMARRRALVRNLASVETLGSTSVICSDKTGTITENRMTVREVLPVDPAALPDLRRVAVLCNNGALSRDGESGDPMETALLRWVRDAGTDPEELRRAEPRRDEEPFDSATMRMITFHDGGAALKGAPERLLEGLGFVRTGEGDLPLDGETRRAWSDRVADLASRGMRTLAFAWGPDPERAALLGIMGILDPPRAEVREAVATCAAAGIKVLMVTGDHPLTARAVAEETGILGAGRVLRGDEFAAIPEEELASAVRDVAVIARVAPEHKHRLVKALQAAGEVVAMTGDGVNDAPALKAADVGIAMGITGTEVSKEAADIVLKDDRFATIVDAVEEGRRIFDNIRKSILFLLCCNLSEVFTVLLGLLANLPAILSPLQILWINLATDVVPALALALDPAERGIMKRVPKGRDEDLLTPPLMRRILLYGVLMTGGVIGAYVLALRMNPGEYEAANEVAFFTLVFAQLIFVLNVRKESFLRDPGQLFRNRPLLAGILATLGIQAGLAYVPLFREVLDIAPLNGPEWACVLAGAIFPTAVGQVRKLLFRDSLPI